MRDFSSLVDELVAEGRLELSPGACDATVTYHDSCHLKRKLGAHVPPRRLLRGSGHVVEEMAESDACCGMGGSYSLKFPEISRQIEFHVPDEKEKRHGQAIAAASLPNLRK